MPKQKSLAKEFLAMAARGHARRMAKEREQRNAAHKRPVSTVVKSAGGSGEGGAVSEESHQRIVVLQ